MYPGSVGDLRGTMQGGYSAPCDSYGTGPGRDACLAGEERTRAGEEAERQRQEMERRRGEAEAQAAAMKKRDALAQERAAASALYQSAPARFVSTPSAFGVGPGPISVGATMMLQEPMQPGMARGSVTIMSAEVESQSPAALAAIKRGLIHGVNMVTGIFATPRIRMK